MDGTKNHKNDRRVSIKILALALALAAIVPSVIFRTLLMFMYVPSESMYPELTRGDTLIGTRVFAGLKRGDVVAFNTEAIVMIKRIVGLPGETVYIDENGTVYIGGVSLDEPYVLNQRRGRSQTFEVPEGCLLLLGDNRSESYDARYWENPYVEYGDVIAIAGFKLPF